ncbi:MAG: diadenylate cyclase CdaA [Acidobacteria bacterium]|nr:diadenylate cyclase CdaA [Acidobacteriota bacterium]
MGFFQSSFFALSDLIDIALVAYVIYRFLLLIRGTRGVQMTFGIVVLLLLYWSSRYLGLDTVQWLLSNALTYIVFAIIVLFQSEIRRGLAGIGKTPILARQIRQRSEGFEEITQAATTLASRKIGALIVIERGIGLKNYVENGIVLDAMLAFDLLVTIFNPNTPLHDGAVIIQRSRIAAAACFLPLTLDPYHSKELGTRHRAAIGITEETDAVAVIVSEETGVISLAINGRITRNLDSVTLRASLETACENAPGKTVTRLARRRPEKI